MSSIQGWGCSIRSTLRVAFLALAFAAVASGCVEICAALNGGFEGCIPGDDDGGTADGSITPPNEDDSADLPRVALSVSNTSPAVNEEVLLTCTLTAGDSTSLRFGFQPSLGRLAVDRVRGTASFVVTAADVGAAFEFTCTAANEAGTSEPSNSVLVLPVGGPEDLPTAEAPPSRGVAGTDRAGGVRDRIGGGDDRSLAECDPVSYRPERAK